VDVSFYTLARSFKSPPFVIIASLLQSRSKLRIKSKKAIDQLSQLERENQQLLERNRELNERLAQVTQQSARLEQQRDQALASVNLPHDPPVGTHGYGAIMIALAVNLGMSVGFRGAERVLRIFYDSFGLQYVTTPSHDSICNWSKRLGVGSIKQSRDRLQSCQKRAILVDHSCQMGNEKLMVVLGIDASQLPEQGQALRREDMQVLEIKSASQWKSEDMHREYESIAERFGEIRQILIDGASELQNGAKSYAQSVQHEVVIQRDAAHYAANQMKSILGKDENFNKVVSEMGTARSNVQQTELAFLSPPTPKNKARFMNLSSIIGWMTMMLWLMRNPDADCRAGLDPVRLQVKFGWIEDYAEQIPIWRECQEVVSKFVVFANEQYLYRGASASLAEAIGELKHAKARELRDRLVNFVSDSELALQSGERLPMSTQLLESVFGLYKQVEGQHSKSGFTGLVSCIPVLLRRTTPAMVRASFAQVSMTDVEVWVKEKIGTTLTSLRRSVYAEHRKALKLATSDLLLT